SAATTAAVPRRSAAIPGAGSAGATATRARTGHPGYRCCTGTTVTACRTRNRAADAVGLAVGGTAVATRASIVGGVEPTTGTGTGCPGITGSVVDTGSREKDAARTAGGARITAG